MDKPLKKRFIETGSNLGKHAASPMKADRNFEKNKLDALKTKQNSYKKRAGLPAFKSGKIPLENP